MIKLIKPLISSGLTSQELNVRCSNSISFDTCSIVINIISENDTRPIWITPDINSINCLKINEVHLFKHLAL